MECYIHQQSPAVGTCVHCGKFVCRECVVEINGKNHCKSCVNEVFGENKKTMDNLENKTSGAPMVFMNAGGAASSSNMSGTRTPVGYTCTKSKVVAAVLAFFVGGFGIHKFYLGSVGMGVLYLLFFWTFIPAFVAFIEGIIYLVTPDDQFNMKYGHPVY